MDKTQTKLARNGLASTKENLTREREAGLTTNVNKAICIRGYGKGTFDLETEHYVGSISVREPDLLSSSSSRITH